MKKKTGWLFLAAALVVLIGGAGVLYNKYSAEVENERLMTEDSTQAEIEENETVSEENAGETSENAGEDAEKELMQAPDFTVYDQAGNAVNLSDFVGKPTIVNFWASWCGPCKSEMPDFEEAYGEYGEEIQFLMVNMTDGYHETIESAKKLITDSGYTFPVYYDTDLEAAKAYSVYSIPVTYFIDKDGYMTAYAQGALDKATLQKGIDLIDSE